jgi:transcriptional regulator with XRE-family HTH domain
VTGLAEHRPRLLQPERIAQGMTWKDVSVAAGVSASTLARLSQGRRPDMDSLADLGNWLGIPLDASNTPRGSQSRC